ncbi:MULTISPECIES: chaperone NapD [unclassified Campylobacter]|uniref:chaperone NapD n=1 Tax=unclassified Campylobacter TaxID=2593542 RepID=UPI001237E81B|nr:MULTISPECIES: chaperone NapD [unclassified Campylobacter]KAA6227201.1 oxidoreductase [Campylobacter sp. LR286c]KAA6228334.1 oxidoreductase [Campylobacter sp. LR196d]KAA6229335.1 oxidoreductase [Campylobacter sp. LR291e]
MNLSSVLIVAKEENIPNLKKDIEGIENCSIELVENGKIVAVIESEDFDSQVGTYKKLEQLPNIIDISMIFTYQDLEEDIDKAQNSDAARVINKDQKAEDIVYGGSVPDEFA